MIRMRFDELFGETTQLGHLDTLFEVPKALYSIIS
jgi:hypothetical protein